MVDHEGEAVAGQDDGDDARRAQNFGGKQGRPLHEILSPLMVRFRISDVLEVIVGASVLAIPVAYTEEVWKLGEQLPMANMVAVVITSFSWMSLFVYYIFYKDNLRGNVGQFLLRVFASYAITLLVVAFILALFQKLPLMTDPAIAVRRMLLVGFPACFSATVVDSMNR